MFAAPAGTRSIQMLYRAVLFTFAPTFIELIFVVGLLANRFSPMVAVLVGCTFALYVAWTLSMTQVSTAGPADVCRCGAQLGVSNVLVQPIVLV
jgi:ABC-type transport system involved in Fe-S cluster assembly fused permease/ATPase subunit